MKKLLAGLIVILLYVSLSAQSPSGTAFITASTASACTAATGFAVTFCGVVGDGEYVAVGTAVFAKITGGSTSSGVATFNNRTGNVLPAAGDYKYSDLAVKPTTISCTTGSAGSTGVSGSGCTIQ